ncbi:MAG: hypothetical protein Q4D03_01680 [Bacteroidales bacterium]|nr:hypothetical protein [Bacteroidales bacterium]
MKRLRNIAFVLILLLPLGVSAQYHARDCFFIYPLQQWECHPNWLLSTIQVGSWHDVPVVDDKEADYVMSQWRADSLSISLVSSDAQLGVVWGSGRYVAGSNVVIAAMPKADVLFVGWSDGVRDNPRSLWLERDMELRADFKRLGSFEESQQLPAVEATITVREQFIYVQGGAGYRIRVYDEWGHCLVDEQRERAHEKGYAVPAAGTYFVQIGATTPQKVIVGR